MNYDNIVDMLKEQNKGLPRAERRRKDKIIDKMSNTIKKFTPAQIEVVDAISRQRVKEELAFYNDMMDSGLSAYLILNNPEKSIEEIQKMEDEISELVNENSEKVLKLERMGADLKKFEAEVKAKCERLINSGITQQSEALKELATAFPMLSKAQLTNGFKKTKAELKEQEETKKEIEEEENPEVKDALKYVFEREENKTIPKNDIEKPQSGNKDKKNVNTPAEEKKPLESELKQKSKLEDMGRLIKGEYGMYLKTDEGVRMFDDERVFSSVDEIEKSKDETTKDIVSEINISERTIEKCKGIIANDRKILSKINGAAEEMKEIL